MLSSKLKAFRKDVEQVINGKEHDLQAVDKGLVFIPYLPELAIPPEISCLQYLESLNLFNNCITLAARDNDLIFIPPAIGELTRLKELHLQNNRLTVLPVELGMLDLCGPKQVVKLYGNSWVAPIADQLQLNISHVFDYIRSETYKLMSDSDSEAPELAFPIESDTSSMRNEGNVLLDSYDYINFVRYEFVPVYFNIRHEASKYPDVISDPKWSSSREIPTTDRESTSRENFESHSVIVTQFRNVVKVRSFHDSDLYPKEYSYIKSQATPNKKQIWAFAVLVALEQPLHPDLCHLLRVLAKRCASLRKVSTTFSCYFQDCAELSKRFVEEDPSALEEQFDFFITIIQQVFGQLDLAEL